MIYYYEGFNQTHMRLINSSRRDAHETREEGGEAARVSVHNSRERSLNEALLPLCEYRKSTP